MKNPYLHLLQTCWRFAGNLRRKYLTTYIMFVVANSIYMVQPVIFGQLLNTLQQNPPDVLPQSIFWLVVLAALIPLFWLFHGTARIRERDVAFFIVKNWRETLFSIVSRLPLKWHQDHHSGSTISKINKSGTALFSFGSDGFQYIETIVKFVLAVVAIIWILPVAALPVLVIGSSTILMMLHFDRKLTSLYDLENEGEHNLTATVFDYVSNMTTVISLRLEELAQKEVVRKIMILWPWYRQEHRLNEMKWFLISMIMSLVNLSILTLYLFQTIGQNQPLLFGTFIMLYQYTERLISSFFDVAWKYERIVRDDTQVLTAEPILRAQDTALKQSSLEHLLPPGWQRMEIQGLTFQHDQKRGEEASLHNVHLVLKRGHRIALVGESGSGKSTSMAILRGLYPANRGTLWIDGKKAISLKVLSGTTTLIPQDPEIFENTIEYNITVGIEHRKKDVAVASDMACFTPVVERLPQGFQTDIREKGVNLSGGEKQRLALARGIFSAQDSSILLLDEPTSSVDGRTEKKIFENLFGYFKDRCIIASIHRLHLLKLFDYVYVLEKGKVVEEGPYVVLLKKKNGHLKKMLEHYEHEEKRKAVPDISLPR